MAPPKTKNSKKTKPKKRKPKEAASTAVAVLGGPGAEHIGWDPDNIGKQYDPADPLGEISIFEETGGQIPSFDSTAARIFHYVDGKAQSIGEHIPRNRGTPHNAEPENMLTPEEKAIILLGRAVGIPYRSILNRLNDLRSDAKIKPISSDASLVCKRVVGDNKEIVAAIQGDMLASVEEWSPLVSGQQRFVWHARMVELYRVIIYSLSKEPEDSIRNIDQRGRVIYLDKVDEIRRLDKAMTSHMKFLEGLGVSGDLAARLSNPSQKIHDQQVKRKEEEIEMAFAEGTITETERLQKLRAIRHGEVI